MAKTSKKLRQRRLPGTEEPTIKALDDAAENYYEAMTERCKLSKTEDEAKDNLIDKMKEHGVDRYETSDGLIVTITAKSNCKVKRKNANDEEDSSNGEA